MTFLHHRWALLVAVVLSGLSAGFFFTYEAEDDLNRLNLFRTVAIGASFIALVTAALLMSSPRDQTRQAPVGHAA